MEEIVLYTANLGDYDWDMPPLLGPTSPDVRYVRFTDKEEFPKEHQQWDNCLIKSTDPLGTAKRLKILSQEPFPDADITVWMDSTMQGALPIRQMADEFLSDADWAMFRHPTRTCTYWEIETCLIHGIGSREALNRQRQSLKELGFPQNWGLYAGTVIFRRHTDKTKEINKLWWDEIQQYSMRDQVSFPYIAWKTDLNVHIIPGSVWASKYFAYQPHKRERNGESAA